MFHRIYFLTLIFLSIQNTILESTCTKEKCSVKHSDPVKKYSKDLNEKHTKLLREIEVAVTKFEPCNQEQCACYKDVIHRDLEPFRAKRISKAMFASAKNKGTVYQIIDGKLYRQKECHFPARCSGLEHYLTQLAATMPDMEFAVNTRDWPQLNKKWNAPLSPIFSFSKTSDYWDIMYPAWSFWEGGPAIKLYPSGLGKWEEHRKSLMKAAERWPWDKKRTVAFFRGSRTSEERDPIILLSRREPHLVDASYTKNQAWKSDADTLHAPPAAEVSLEDHCQYKYLFNYRGVAASFRFKHLFLCKSLVFHVGDDWQEFFYPSMKPWVHYVPVPTKATEADLKDIIQFFTEHDDLARDIAERGFQHIWNNLRIKDVKCYWRSLLKQYSKLVQYDVVKDESLIEVKSDRI